MLFHLDYKKLITSLLIPIVMGSASALLIRSDTDIYKTLKKPPLAPPSWLFPVAWTLLYFLMGISLYLIRMVKTTQDKNSAYIIFALQLLLNFLWSPVFFIARAFLPSLVILILLFVCVGVMIYAFYKFSRTAALLQIPYFLWLIFAGYLNCAVYILN